MAHEVTADLDDIFYMQLEYAKRVENLIKNPLIDASEIQKQQSELTDVITEVEQHKRAILIRKREIFPPSGLPAAENDWLTLQLELLGMKKSEIDGLHPQGNGCGSDIDSTGWPCCS